MPDSWSRKSWNFHKSFPHVSSEYLSVTFHSIDARKWRFIVVSSCVSLISLQIEVCGISRICPTGAFLVFGVATANVSTWRMHCVSSVSSTLASSSSGMLCSKQHGAASNSFPDLHLSSQHPDVDGVQQASHSCQQEIAKCFHPTSWTAICRSSIRTILPAQPQARGSTCSAKPEEENASGPSPTG